ncbi:MAG: basic amino acid ABC transporter substrate-binding protein [Cellulosilyticaceae bacterium]
MKKNIIEKIGTVLLIGVLGMGVLTGCAGSAKGEGQKTLKMGTNAAFPPFEYYEENKITGFDVELANVVAEKLGMELVVEDMEFNTLLGAVSNNMIDFVAAGMTVTEERQKQVEFTQGYFDSKQMIIVKSNNTDIAGPDDLVGKKIGVQLGTTSDQFAEAYIEGAQVIKFDKAALAVADLKNGTVDAVIVDAQPAKELTKGQEDLKILESPFVEEEYAIAVKKGNTELLEKINKAIEEIKASGEYDKLYGKYFAEVE